MIREILMRLFGPICSTVIPRVWSERNSSYIAFKPVKENMLFVKLEESACIQVPQAHVNITNAFFNLFKRCLKFRNFHIFSISATVQL